MGPPGRDHLSHHSHVVRWRPYFAALRKRILKKAFRVALDLIDKRSDVFLDVLYDLCVIVLRRAEGQSRPAVAKTSLLLSTSPPLSWQVRASVLSNDHVWALPDGDEGLALFRLELETLADYGYLAKTGYFVWNREQHRYRIGKKPRPKEVPLFGPTTCAPTRSASRGTAVRATLVLRKSQISTAILRSDAIILQRTSNRRQKRRLIGAVIRHAG